MQLDHHLNRQTLQVYASRDSVGDAIRKGGNKLEDAADSVADGFRGGKEDVKGAARDAKHAGRDARGEVDGKVSAAGVFWTGLGRAQPTQPAQTAPSTASVAARRM